MAALTRAEGRPRLCCRPSTSSASRVARIIELDLSLPEPLWSNANLKRDPDQVCIVQLDPGSLIAIVVENLNAGGGAVRW
jgi:hypothetical protein